MDLQLTQEQKDQMARLMAESLPSIHECLQARLSGSVENIIHNRLEKEVGDYIHNWCATSLLPLIEKTLIEGTPGLVSVAQAVSAQVCVSLQENFVATVKERMSQSYNRRDLLKAIFG